MSRKAVEGYMFGGSALDRKRSSLKVPGFGFGGGGICFLTRFFNAQVFS